MVDVSLYFSVESCQFGIDRFEENISREFKKLYRIHKRLKKSRELGDAIIKETDQIDFLLDELQKNLPLLQSDDAKTLHEERITDLKLRKMTLENQKPYYAPSEYEQAENVMAMHQKLIDDFKEFIVALKNKIEILKEAENKVKDGGQSTP